MTFPTAALSLRLENIVVRDAVMKGEQKRC